MPHDVPFACPNDVRVFELKVHLVIRPMADTFQKSALVEDT